MIKGKGIFKVMINGVVKTYNHWNKIPSSFDNMIMFNPDYEPGPHSKEQHEYYDSFNSKLKELMRREKK